VLLRIIQFDPPINVSQHGWSCGLLEKRQDGEDHVRFRILKCSGTVTRHIHPGQGVSPCWPIATRFCVRQGPRFGSSLRHCASRRSGLFRLLNISVRLPKAIDALWTTVYKLPKRLWSASQEIARRAIGGDNARRSLLWSALVWDAEEDTTQNENCKVFRIA